MHIRIPAVILVALSLSLPASADVIYTLSFSNVGGASGTYSFLESALLTTNADIAASDTFNDSQTGGTPLTSIQIDPLAGAPGCTVVLGPCVAVLFTGPGVLGIGQNYTVPLTSLGTYSGGLITTTIASTPEPSAFALLGTGLFGIGYFVRRRRA